MVYSQLKILPLDLDNQTPSLKTQSDDVELRISKLFVESIKI